ncbi:Eco57I restriction-modification methylase domain-containing protein [Corynebacterium freiburgense]|uniref:Eco57I restriction-modification methylase domain-containing protein n=1 Tax=Corynebacterium freiburgense TaxID=556548 RepID=UPI00041D7028|nr:DNA methyltransferase [Corynebacterium freiburgense]WJZ03244.1 hypothetical protein CFREI_09835 [Corynebacterium freiburgense]
MATFDSIINVEEWISDHYFTTDEKGKNFTAQVKAAHTQWKAEEADTNTSPWTRFTALQRQLQQAFATSDHESVTQLAELHNIIRQAFGFTAPTELTAERAGDDIHFTGSLCNTALLIDAASITSHEELGATTPLHPVFIGDKPGSLTIQQLVSDIFLSNLAPAYIIILAGKWAVLAERDSWPLGRYLAVELALVLERNDTKAAGELRRVIAMFAREHVEQGADGSIWWTQVREESLEHAIKVSAELRQAIKHSIEIIGTDVLDRFAQQNKDSSDIDGNELAKEAIRYLYRILFLLFAESSPELNILPTGTPEYDEGYGLSRIRDLILSPPSTPAAQQGTHLYQSLDRLFTLINNGHNPKKSNVDSSAADEGLRFRNLNADLFQPRATHLIDQVKLSNQALHEVLQNLLLSSEQSGRDRGFISYATLGVTELGQVYEGLMSYSGSIATETLLEVAPNGDASKGSWVVPQHIADQIDNKHFVKAPRAAEEGGIDKDAVRRYAPGSFVFRQSSRDRARSASFYTPAVLTQFTVSQALEELQASGRIQTAEDVLTLSVCEPAMGSGAFAVEVVHQLAELYIKLRQQELDTQIPAEQRALELQKIKAHIALHQIHGVDLNKTAVELAEISLWLDTMTAELQAPWFGLHLRHGNSLIGARRSTYSVAETRNKAYLTQEPKHHPLTSLRQAITNIEKDITVSGRIHQFLLPSQGWGAAAEAKDLKDIAKKEIADLKKWRLNVRNKLTDHQIKALQDIAARVEQLWQFALIRTELAEDQARRDVRIWGRESTNTAKNVTRKDIEKDLFNNADGAYRRLRLIMDSWHALWFWPLDATTPPPDINEWIRTLQSIVGTTAKTSAKNAQQYALGQAPTWDEINAAEETDCFVSGALKSIELLDAHPWLRTVQEVTAAQNFFHWDLDFAAVMAKGGFDLQVGNPPWVRPRTDVDALLSETDPWFSLAHKPTQKEKKERRETALQHQNARAVLLRGITEVVATSEILTDPTLYPHLQGQQPDLYRGFMARTWNNASPRGVISLIHPKSHFTEAKAISLRSAAYKRLRKNWHLTNKLALFDIDANEKNFDIAIYGAPKDNIKFQMASGIHHPKTLADSLVHDGSGPVPAFKTDDGKWDLRPHRDRIITVDESTLEVWNSILEEPDTPLLHTRMVYTVNSEASKVLEKLARAPRMKTLGLQFSAGWHETGDKKKGYFDSKWEVPSSWNDVILQGPHLGVSTPMIKQPNETMKHNQDWTEVDLEAMPADFIPATAYQPDRQEKPDYDAAYGSWEIDGKPIPVSSTYRVAWRAMAATTGFRTFYPSLVPAKATHVHGAHSAGPILDSCSLFAATAASSFLNDYLVRSSGLSNLYGASFEVLALGSKQSLWPQANNRYLHLNCLTSAYAPLWEEITGETWTPDTPIRNALERQKAQTEIDAIVALCLDVTADELCMIYRTQFPVMRRYDQENHFDAHGRLVPKSILKEHSKLKNDDRLSESARTWTHPQSNVTYVFEYPFIVFDREAALRAAYAKYKEMM